jgi:hypothetical protein
MLYCAKLLEIDFPASEVLGTGATEDETQRPSARLRRTQRAQVLPVAAARLLIGALRTRFAFVEVAFTAAIEQHLDAIGEGTARYLDVVRDADTQLQIELSAFTGSRWRPRRWRAPAPAQRAGNDIRPSSVVRDREIDHLEYDALGERDGRNPARARSATVKIILRATHA